MSRIRVLIADDQPLIRAGIAALLARKPEIEVVAEANDGQEALDLAAQYDPDVVLMDVMMPRLDGITATQRLHERGPRPAVIILSTIHDNDQILRGIAAGARGYLLKDVDHRELAEAIQIVAAGGARLHGTVTAQLLPHLGQLSNPPSTAPNPVVAPKPELQARLALLTERERAILHLLGQGHTNQEIGDQLVLSIGTVKNHISSLLAKLDVRDRTQAALFARDAGV